MSQRKLNTGVALSEEDHEATAEVLLPLALDCAYTYRVPPEMSIEPGSYVSAPLGPRDYLGVVWHAEGNRQPRDKLTKLRDITQVFDQPPMPALQRRFLDWLGKYYLAQPGMVLRMALRVPAALGPALGRTAYVASGLTPKKITAARQRVLDVAQGGPALEAREIAEMAGVGTSVIKSLVQQGVLEAVELPAFRKFGVPEPHKSGVTLSPMQQKAAEVVAAAASKHEHSVTVIEGVTGSGKTEVYFEAMATAVASSKQALLLVPEIALTSQFIDRVEERFGARPAEWHSDLRPRERERVWRGVANGDVRILVGARSALFLPWQRLGLIVVDEEHENAFKQEEGVPYHARDMAVVYGSLGGFAVILASATPSLETLVNVDRGRYQRVALQDRIGRAGLPSIELIDMRSASMPSGTWISDPLAAAVDETLAKGQQALLFLNRRGYAPLTLCRSCGHRVECVNCSASLVEHRFRKIMLCHHCGHQQALPRACPACLAEGQLVPCGPGVERLAEEVQRRFPAARTMILSSDLRRGASLKDALREIKDGKHNLIIGTQLVAKGHHFPDLTLAGVIDADVALETSDPRAGERTFQLLRQVSGRAGRGDSAGRALIQTFNPQHPLMIALCSGDTQSFIAQEKRMRETALLPPYGRLAGIIISGSDANETERLARRIASGAPAGEGIELLGPAPAPIAVVRGRYRWRMLVRSKRDANIQDFIRAWLKDIDVRGSLRIEIDIDPYQFL